MTGQSALVFLPAQSQPAKSQEASHAMSMEHGLPNGYSSDRQHTLSDLGRLGAGQEHQVAQQASQLQDHNADDASEVQHGSELIPAEEIDNYEDAAWEELEGTGQLLLPDGQPWQAHNPRLDPEADTGPALEASPAVPEAGPDAMPPEAPVNTEAAAADEDPSSRQQIASSAPETASSDAPAGHPEALQSSPHHPGDEPAEGHDVPQLASPVPTTSLEPQAEANRAGGFHAHAQPASGPEDAHAAAQADTGIDRGLSAENEAGVHNDLDDQYASADQSRPVNTAPAGEHPAEGHQHVHPAAPTTGPGLAASTLGDRAATPPTDLKNYSLDAPPPVTFHDRHSRGSNEGRLDQPTSKTASPEIGGEHKVDSAESDGLSKLPRGSGKDSTRHLQQENTDAASEQPIKGLPTKEDHGSLQGARQTENLRYAADWETESEASASPIKHQSSPE